MSETTTAYPEVPESANRLRDAVEAARIAEIPHLHGASGERVFEVGDTKVFRGYTDADVREVSLKAPRAEYFNHGFEGDREGNISSAPRDMDNEVEVFRTGQPDRLLTGPRGERAAEILRNRAARQLISQAIETADDRQKRVQEIAQKHSK